MSEAEWKQKLKDAYILLSARDAEIKKLRDALEYIVEVGDCQTPDWYCDIAREALK